RDSAHRAGAASRAGRRHPVAPRASGASAWPVERPRRMRTALVAYLSAAILVDLAFAQVRVVRRDDDRLAGISQVDIVVDVLEPSQAEACALDRGDLQQAALAALRDGRLAASVSDKASSWFHTLEVTVSTGAAGTWCVTF